MSQQKPIQMAADGSSTPSTRLLRAVEVIATHGPLSYADLKTRLDMSKTATWRLVQSLIAAGWVRLRHSGSLIELDSRLDDLFSTAHFSDPEFQPIIDALPLLSEQHPVQVDLFVLDRAGKVTLWETTRRMTGEANLSLAEDESVLLALRAAMTRQQLSRHLVGVLEQQPTREDGLALVQQLRRQLNGLPGFAWAFDRQAMSISVRGKMGTPAAIRIAPKSFTPGEGLVVDVFRDLRFGLSPHLESFGLPGKEPLSGTGEND